MTQKAPLGAGGGRRRTAHRPSIFTSFVPATGRAPASIYTESDGTLPRNAASATTLTTRQVGSSCAERRQTIPVPGSHGTVPANIRCHIHRSYSSVGKVTVSDLENG